MQVVAVTVVSEVAALREGGRGTRHVWCTVAGELRLLEFSRVPTLFAADLLPLEVQADKYLLCELGEVDEEAPDPASEVDEGRALELDAVVAHKTTNKPMRKRPKARR